MRVVQVLGCGETGVIYFHQEEEKGWRGGGGVISIMVWNSWAHRSSCDRYSPFVQQEVRISGQNDPDMTTVDTHFWGVL